jgi:hypothetical protein
MANGTAPGGSTFDGNANLQVPTTVGYRPGTADFNGAALADSQTNPPNAGTMPTAALLNTYGYMLISACGMIPFGVISVNAGASPTTAFWKVAALKILTNPFTITRNSVGNYNITYAANTFPAPISQPNAALNVVLGAHNYGIGAVNITNGCQVTTVQDAALTDLNFTLWFF